MRRAAVILRSSIVTKSMNILGRNPEGRAFAHPVSLLLVARVE